MSENVNAQDQTFLVSASQSGLSEILEGSLAAGVSNSLTVAGFGRWMAADHSWLQSGLDGQAQQAGLEVPAPSLSPTQSAELTALLPLSGTVFDAAYVPAEVGDHQTTIALFQSEIAGGSNPGLVQSAQEALPILQQHLNAASMLTALESGTSIPAFTQPIAVAGPAPAASGPLNAQDMSFVTTSSQSGLTEIAAGQLAEQIAPDSFIKGFGDWMITDHATLNANVSALSAMEGMAAPTTPDAMQQQMLASLSTLSGVAFEQQYMTTEVQGHLQTLMGFQQEIAGGSDPALVASATQGLPLIQSHLAEAVTLDVVVHSGLTDQTAAPDTLAGQFLGLVQDAMTLNTNFAVQTANALLSVTTEPVSGQVGQALGGAIAFLHAAGNIPAVSASSLASAYTGVMQDVKAGNASKALSDIAADLTKVAPSLSGSLASLIQATSGVNLTQPENLALSAGSILASALQQAPPALTALTHHIA